MVTLLQIVGNETYSSEIVPPDTTHICFQFCVRINPLLLIPGSVPKYKMLISIISFIAIHFAPNSFMGGELNPNMTPEAIAQLKSIYGLDKPLFTQYIDWMNNLFHLNFGISFVSGAQVSDVILERLPVTLLMNVVALIVTFVLFQNLPE